jgi:hypothetical protein
MPEIAEPTRVHWTPPPGSTGTTGMASLMRRLGARTTPSWWRNGRINLVLSCVDKQVRDRPNLKLGAGSIAGLSQVVSTAWL